MSTEQPYWELRNRYGDVVGRGVIEFEKIESWTEAGVHVLTVISRDCLPELERKGDVIVYHGLEKGYDVV